MSAEPALSRAWKVGARTVTLSMARPVRGRPMSAVVEWDPEAPLHLSAAEWSQYRIGRNAALEELSAELGIRTAVIDL